MRARAAVWVAIMVAALGSWPGSLLTSQEVALATRSPRFLYAPANGGPPVEIDASRHAIFRRVVSLQVARPTVGRLLAEIEQQTRLKFVHEGELDVDRPLTFEARALTLASALAAILHDAGVDVVLSRGGYVSLVAAGGKNSAMQGGTISGRVTDAKSGDGLGGVDVSLEGTRWLATTDAEGRYRLADVTPGSYTVLARRIGYRPERRAVTVTAGQETAVDVVALQPAATRLSEVVVTAQKREERLEDVPISISVLPADELDRSTFMDATEALKRVPGVAFQQDPVGGVQQVGVRGVFSANTIAGGAATAAFYLDEVPFGFAKTSFTPNPDIYDLERIEVLRGPQGTLYGANALNGVVRVLTKEADPSAFEFKARTSASGTQYGGENFRGDLAVNVPLVEGKLAARAVVGYQDWNGWIDRPQRKDANDAERRNMRLKINAQPTEQLSIGASAWFSREDYGSPATGEDTRHNLLTPVDEPASMDADAYGLKIGYELPWASITSMTSYIDYKNFSTLDLTFVGLPVLDEIRLEAETFAQEVLLQSTHGGPWRWSVGGMYRDSKDLLNELLPGLLPPAIDRNISKSYAVFGEVTRSFLDGQLELTGGLRYFEDDVALRELSSFSGAPPEELIRADATFSATTPRVVLTWHPGEQMTVYGSYSEGFRSGAHQLPTVLLVAPFPSAEPDRLANYEVGAKGSLGGRLNFETALYYMDWQDAQQLSVVLLAGNPFPAIHNAGSASGLGVDLGVTARPVDALGLGVNFSWNDLTFDSQVFSQGVVQFDEGDRVNFSPEYTVGGWADYSFPLGRTGFEAGLSASADYTSATLERFVSAGTVGAAPGDAILLARTGVSIRAPEHWVATLFVGNLNNERGSPRRNLGIPQWNARVRPRTVGVQLEYRF